MQKEWKSFAGTSNAPRRSMGSHPPPQWRRDQNPRPTHPVHSGGLTCWRCGEKGHVRSVCRVRLDHSRRELNGRRSADRTFEMQCPSVKTDLVGHSNEVDICIEGIQTAALFDTGASISTVSEAFHREKLSHLPVQRELYSLIFLLLLTPYSHTF